MVSNVTSLTGHGLRDWLIQRVSAVILAIYLAVLAGFLIKHPEISYEAWHGFFACTAIQVLSSLAWLSLVLHTWIGLWTVTTDYLKPLWLRLSLQMLIAAGLIGLFFWGILIFWRV